MNHDPNSRERLSVSDAAKRLGVSTEAIRGRIKRGTIEHEKVDGMYYVYLQNPSEGDSEDAQNSTQNELANAALLSHIETLKREVED